MISIVPIECNVQSHRDIGWLASFDRAELEMHGMQHEFALLDAEVLLEASLNDHFPCKTP